jgi:flavin reductase (DIM6/NTAB) family NADH-FMN oxidoreductase RutF
MAEIAKHLTRSNHSNDKESMFYSTEHNQHGLKFDPFKALVAPRPIGWISTISNEGIHNLAPYSYFNAIGERPPMVMFSSAGMKDSLRNIEANGEFTCSVATWDLREQMNLSSAPVATGVDEFKLAGLTPTPGSINKTARVGESPAALECRHWKTIELPDFPSPISARHTTQKQYLVVGMVVGIYIDERIIRDGIVDTAAMGPIARMGYMDYARVNHDSTFTMNRPIASADRQTASVLSGAWDGVYR